MAAYYDQNSLLFICFQVHEMADLFAMERYEGYDTDSAKMLLHATEDWASRDFYPFYREMDEHPARYAEGGIITHPVVKTIFEHAGANGYLGNYFDAGEGGSQMPFMLAGAVSHILQSANNHIPGYLGLTTGAAHLISSFGSEALKTAYIPLMLSGKWAGTMALTEPQAGSALSEISTSAKPLEDGSFLITGQKIFISGGGQSATENIIHLTLARIEGAPAGTKGISLFVIPALLPNKGTLKDNDVTIAGDFQKMGQRGYSTAHLIFGEKNNCRGFLVGEPNQGLAYMFQMMNGARIDVGMTAASVAMAAHRHTLQYASERRQGRKLTPAKNGEILAQSCLIIEHPDVRRMLYQQKAIAEGSLSLLLYCLKLQDLSTYGPASSRNEYRLLLELLTPVAKTYPSEMGRVAVDSGLQTLGGYGFCTDFPLQQYLRDIRIMSIYEGTTGIQALDLLGRKVTLENGQALHIWKSRLENDIADAEKYKELRIFAQELTKYTGTFEDTLRYLLAYAMTGDSENYLADATLFLEMFGHLAIAHQWIIMAAEAQKLLENETLSEEQVDFYEGKIHTMKYFFKYELPKVSALSTSIISDLKVTTDQFHKTAFFNP